MEKKFATIEELKTQAIKDGACEQLLKWLDKQASFDQVIKNISIAWRMWCLVKRYSQFEKDCDWNKLNGGNWAYLLRYRPDFSGICPWKKLDEYNLAYLFRYQPQITVQLKKVV